jgi:hypothetical protein
MQMEDKKHSSSYALCVNTLSDIGVPKPLVELKHTAAHPGDLPAEQERKNRVCESKTCAVILRSDL